MTRTENHLRQIVGMLMRDRVHVGSIEFEVLLEALDQYVENQREHEECEGIATSPKLAAAERMIDQLNAQLAELSD